MGENGKEKRQDVNQSKEPLDDFNITDEEQLDIFYELSKRSLEEVKHLTEYEDEKANRTLTAIAFLSALAGAVFIALVPKSQQGAILAYKDWNWAVFGFYFYFALFLICLIVGTVLVVWALLPRFNIPHNFDSNKPDPVSFLFFEFILRVSSQDWQKAFSSKTPEELKTEYTKCNIREAYLVAEKIATKLKFLQRGVRLLWFALILLVPWFIFCALRVLYPSSADNSFWCPLVIGPGLLFLFFMYVITMDSKR